MPTKPSKGDHGNADQGSHGRGPQKATQGSSTVGVQEQPDTTPPEEQGAQTARPQPAGDVDKNP